MSAALAGRKIAGVKRYGKFIVASLSGGAYSDHPSRHDGALLLGGPKGKHTHAILTLDKGVLLYDDSRQFGCIEYSEAFPKRVARLGPEPLEIGVEEFVAGLKRRKTSIKALLLNQAFVRGIGNIYADEALFRAGIHPQTMAARLRADRARKLHAAIVEVLSRGDRSRRLVDFRLRGCGGAQRLFPVQHRVYQRTGEPCVTCGDRGASGYWSRNGRRISVRDAKSVNGNTIETVCAITASCGATGLFGPQPLCFHG